MKTSYEVFGEKGEPVVLLHGSMASKSQWKPLASILKESYRVITIDLYGYGDMPLPEKMDTYTLEDESGLINTVLNQEIGYESYHLVGHSYGGVIAFFHTFYNQDRIKSLTAFEPMSFHLLDQSDAFLEGAAELITQISALVKNNQSETAAKMFMDLWMPEGIFEVLPKREKERLALGVKKMVLDFRAASTAPLKTSHYEKLNMPICLIAGKQSPDFSTAITDVFNRILKNNTLNWVSGGHFSPISHSDEVNPIIVNFLKSESLMAS